MPGSAEKVIYFFKVSNWHFGRALRKLLHHHIPHHRCQEIVVIARCGLGDEGVDKRRLGITGFAHSGPVVPQYGKRVPIFPDQAYCG